MAKLATIESNEIDGIMNALVSSAKCIKEIVPLVNKPRSNVTYYIYKLNDMGLVEVTYYKKQTIVALTNAGKKYLKASQTADTIFIIKRSKN